MIDNIDRDATEFGQHVRAGGWRLGLLVARNVDATGKGGNAALDRPTSSADEVGKVSMVAFARKAGTGDHRVKRYLQAWEAAAANGVVPAAAELSPGQDVDLDTEKLPNWADYYPPGGTDLTQATPEARAAYEKAAKEVGTTANEIARVASSPKAIKGALKVSDKLRREIAKDDQIVHAIDGAYSAHLHEEATKAGIRPQPPDHEADQITAFGEVTQLLMSATRMLRTARSHMADIPMDEEIKAALNGHTDRLSMLLEAIRLQVNGGEVSDEMIAALMEGEK